MPVLVELAMVPVMLPIANALVIIGTDHVTGPVIRTGIVFARAHLKMPFIFAKTPNFEANGDFRSKTVYC